MITHQWAHALTLARERVTIPVIDEFFTVLLNIIKEECVQKPDVLGIILIKEVEASKAGEKGPPASGKMTSSLKPKSLNPGVVGGPMYGVNTGDMGTITRTYVPHINDARFGPRYIIIHVQRSTFSDPLSPRMREGHPYVLMMSRNSLRTICAVFLVDTLIPVI